MVCFVYILNKIPFSESHDVVCVAKGIPLEASRKLIYFHFYHIPSEIDKCPAIAVNLVIASLYMRTLNFSQPNKR